MIQQIATWAGIGAVTVLCVIAWVWIAGCVYLLILNAVEGHRWRLNLPKISKRHWYTAIALVAVTTTCIIIGCIGEAIIHMSKQ